MQFWRAVHLAEAPSRWLQGHQPTPSQPPARDDHDHHHVRDCDDHDHLRDNHDHVCYDHDHGHVCDDHYCDDSDADDRKNFL